MQSNCRACSRQHSCLQAARGDVQAAIEEEKEEKDKKEEK